MYLEKDAIERDDLWDLKYEIERVSIPTARNELPDPLKEKVLDRLFGWKFGKLNSGSSFHSDYISEYFLRGLDPLVRKDIGKSIFDDYTIVLIWSTKHCYGRGAYTLGGKAYRKRRKGIFGWVEGIGGIAMVFYSTFPYERELIGAHEIGHLFGLEHCTNPNCLMSEKLDLFKENTRGEFEWDVGEELIPLCSSCEEKLREKLSEEF